MWRALTTFLYFGPMSIELVLHLFFMCVFLALDYTARCAALNQDPHSLAVPSMRYSRQLEENSYAGKKADYLWLLFCCGLMLLVSPSALASFRLTSSLTRWVFVASAHITILSGSCPFWCSKLRDRLHLVSPEPFRSNESDGRRHVRSFLPLTRSEILNHVL